MPKAWVPTRPGQRCRARCALHDARIRTTSQELLLASVRERFAPAARLRRHRHPNASARALPDESQRSSRPADSRLTREHPADRVDETWPAPRDRLWPRARAIAELRAWREPY